MHTRLGTLLLIILLLAGCRSSDQTIVARPTPQFVSAFESATCKEKTPGAQYAAVCVDGTHLNSTLAEACDEHGGMYQVVVCPTPRSANGSVGTPTPDMVLTVEAMATATATELPQALVQAATLPRAPAPPGSPTASAQASPGVPPTAHAQFAPTAPAAAASATPAPAPAPTSAPAASPAATNTAPPAGTTVVAPTATSATGMSETETPTPASLASATAQVSVTPRATVPSGPTETPVPNSVAWADIVAQSHTLTGTAWTNYKQQLLGKIAWHWVGYVNQITSVGGYFVEVYMDPVHNIYTNWDVRFLSGAETISRLTNNQKIQFTGNIEEIYDPAGTVGVRLGLRGAVVNNYNP